MLKKLIMIDLDGVLNSYCGKYDKDEILPPNEDARNFLCQLSNDYRIVIFTAQDVEKVDNWLKKHQLMQYVDSVSNSKCPKAILYLDDRAINFDGDYNKALEKIRNFIPYWKNPHN